MYFLIYLKLTIWRGFLPNLLSCISCMETILIKSFWFVKLTVLFDWWCHRRLLLLFSSFFTLTRSSWDQNESIKNQYFSFLRFYTKAAVCWRNQLYSKLFKIAILYDDHHPVLNVFFATDCLFWCAKLKNLFFGLAFNLFLFKAWKKVFLRKLTVFALAFLDQILIFDVFMTGFAVKPGSVKIKMKHHHVYFFISFYNMKTYKYCH